MSLSSVLNPPLRTLVVERGNESLSLAGKDFYSHDWLVVFFFFFSR